nr:hypothetical protein [uncultured Campylobacter sp.]
MEGCALAKKLLVCLIFALGGLGELWTLTRAYGKRAAVGTG